MHNCYVFSLTVRTSASSCSSRGPGGGRWPMCASGTWLFPPPGRSAGPGYQAGRSHWPWVDRAQWPQGRQLANCCGALEGQYLPIQPVFCKVHVHRLEVFFQVQWMRWTSWKGNGAGSGGDQSPACGQAVEDGPLLAVFEGVYLPQMFGNKQENFPAKWTFSCLFGSGHL